MICLGLMCCGVQVTWVADIECKNRSNSSLEIRVC